MAAEQIQEEALNGTEREQALPDIPEMPGESDNLGERYKAIQRWYYELCDTSEELPKEKREEFGEKIRDKLREIVPPQARFTTEEGSEYYILNSEESNNPRITLRVKNVKDGRLGKIQPPMILLGFINEGQFKEIGEYAMMDIRQKGDYESGALTVKTQEEGRTFAFKLVDFYPRSGLTPMEFECRRGSFPELKVDLEASTVTLKYDRHTQPPLHTGHAVKEIPNP